MNEPLKSPWPTPSCALRGSGRLVFLPHKDRFVKFGHSGTSSSNLTKSLLVLSPCFRASVVSFSLSARRNSMVTEHTKAFSATVNAIWRVK